MRVMICISSEKKIDFMSRLIERILCRNYSHIFVVHKDTIYHAVGKGISTKSYVEYRKTHEIVGEKEVELYCNERVFLKHFIFYRGLEYSFSQALGFIPFFGRLFKNGRKSAWCSEYVSWVLNDLGRRWEFADADTSTPRIFEKI